MKTKYLIFLILLFVKSVLYGIDNRIESLSFSSGAIISLDCDPFYNKASLSFSITDDFGLRYSFGFFGTTKKENIGITYVFKSINGVSNTLDLVLKPIQTKRIGVNVGVGLAQIYYKKLKTINIIIKQPSNEESVPVLYNL